MRTATGGDEGDRGRGEPLVDRGAREGGVPARRCAGGRRACGRRAVAVRNLPEQSYNPIYSSHIDPVRQYQMLRSRGLLTRAKLSRLMNKRVWGIRDNLILALRCARDPRYGVTERNRIWRQDRRYWRFYLYLAPIVTLRRWVVCPAYRLGQMVLRRYERARGIPRRVRGAR